MVLAVVVVSIGVMLWLACDRARRLRRLQAVDAQVLPCDSCIACGSLDVEGVAAEVVRCRACGFVGGEGMGEWQRARLAAQIESMSTEERQALAREKLREAHANLDTAQELLTQAWRASWLDLFGFSFDRGNAKLSDMTSGVAQMRMALVYMGEGAQLLSAGNARFALDIDERALIYALDTGWLTDVWWVDLYAHRRIGKARRQLDALRANASALSTWAR